MVTSAAVIPCQAAGVKFCQVLRESACGQEINDAVAELENGLSTVLHLVVFDRFVDPSIK